MSKKQKTLYICQNCKSKHSRWEGRCSSCGEWNTIEEKEITEDRFTPNEKDEASSELLQSFCDLPVQEGHRISTGQSDLDLVLGGGFVPGSFVLLAGEPGVGKSTLMLELCRSFPKKVYYFSGEESVSQIALRARRLELKREDVFLSRMTDPMAIASCIRSDRPGLALIDSIQTLYLPGKEQMPGMVSQLKESAMILLEAAKTSAVPVLLSGHITKDGNVAGPKLLEHMVDAVLYFESDRLNHYRLLRATKNRFGAVGEVALFEMERHGLRSVDLYATEAAETSEEDSPGRVMSVIREGSRSLVIEVQALVSRSPYGPARRMAEGLDSKRLMLMAAVLEKFLKLRLSECDIFANLAGGLSAREPALDLAVCAAILSSYHELPFPSGTACLGEVGLSGEVRPVPRMAERISELSRIGYSKILCPKKGLDKLFQRGNFERGDTELLGLSNITELSSIFQISD